MKSLICRIVGHRWEVIDRHTDYCLRCKQVKVETNVIPVSELDEIIHDKDWYTPKKWRRP
jgi:hypothetical protein